LNVRYFHLIESSFVEMIFQIFELMIINLYTTSRAGRI
jgi:hypothetical protein